VCHRDGDPPAAWRPAPALPPPPQKHSLKVKKPRDLDRGWGDLLLEKMIALVHVEPTDDDDLEFFVEAAEAEQAVGQAEQAVAVEQSPAEIEEVEERAVAVMVELPPLLAELPAAEREVDIAAVAALEVGGGDTVESQAPQPAPLVAPAFAFPAKTMRGALEVLRAAAAQSTGSAPTNKVRQPALSLSLSLSLSLRAPARRRQTRCANLVAEQNAILGFGKPQGGSRIGYRSVRRVGEPVVSWTVLLRSAALDRRRWNPKPQPKTLALITLTKDPCPHHPTPRCRRGARGSSRSRTTRTTRRRRSCAP
jgi:hypothetical protein